MSSTSNSWSLTSHLLSVNTEQFTRATQSPFLRVAASGSLSKATISHWLANDRLYIQGYIRLTGELLRTLSLPAKPTASKDKGTIELQLVDWLIDALVNIRREEKFFLDVAERHGLDIDITDSAGVALEDKKILGLQRFEKLFSSLTTGQNHHDMLPWLEGVVLFWATEKLYFTAWSWAKQKVESSANSDMSKDADGGAMRKEFIPNWTNEEFIKFVETLERILDDGVEQEIHKNGGYKMEIIGRAERVWMDLLDAEEAFWPRV